MACKKFMPALGGGLAGGVVFGAYMGYMGSLPMVAGLVGSDSAAVGFVLHLVLSVVIAFGFCGLFGKKAAGNPGAGALWGLVYGGVWWLLGPLLLMPLMMGMGLGVNLNAEAATNMLPSLWGHLAYGLILGIVYAYLRKK